MLRIYYTDVRGLKPDWERYPVSKERLERVLRISRPMDQARSMGAELLLNAALSRLFPDFTPPVEMERGVHGKPVFKEQERFLLPSGKPVEFNLSHSGNYAACALGDGPLGIDIEEERDRIRPGILRFLAPEERADLEASDNPDSRFFDYWVLKESYMKAVGTGFAKPPASFVIRREPEGFRAFEAGAFQDFRFHLYRGPAGCRMAVCTQGDRWEEAEPEEIRL